MPSWHIRQLSHFRICRTLGLSSMSGNYPISASAGHSASLPCPAIIPLPQLPDARPLLHIRQLSLFRSCRTLGLSSVSDNYPFSAVAGHHAFLAYPAIIPLPQLPDIMPSWHVRQLSHLSSRRTLDLSSVSGNYPISAPAGHSASPPCPAIIPFPHLPDTRPLLHIRQLSRFRICRTPCLPGISGNYPIYAAAGHLTILNSLEMLCLSSEITFLQRFVLYHKKKNSKENWFTEENIFTSCRGINRP